MGGRVGDHNPKKLIQCEMWYRLVISEYEVNGYEETCTL